ncbi:ribonuclease P protein component [Gammaproteobacteria bacterium]|nr:ribonuclease P protein component [Gammaproteobacteria bacterium]MDB4059365.1 ribonuclease P protein component [Gammaproteobacteria bacterium]MDC1190811.1 ribonuclease P protein component [Gammaproteobacteria bacterium]MDC1491440.1 ribonuclease P protein component [Gammaproteobacteria bacterium]
MALQRLPKPIFSSSNFRVFAVSEKASGLRISTPKKFFKLAVTRNKIKRQIKSIFHTNDLHQSDTLFVIMIYKPFITLSYKEASFEICKAVKS